MTSLWFRSLLVLGAAVSLSACIVSKQLLFNPSDALTSISPGQFEVQNYDFKLGAWEAKRKELVTLKLQGRTYVLTSKIEESTDDVREFTLFDIGGGFFVAATLLKEGNDKERGAEYYYELLEINGTEILKYGVYCETLVKTRLPSVYRPVVEGSKDAPEAVRYCKFSNRETLVAALLVYARYMQPIVRYRSVKG
jgi:hypothetical protein